MIRVKPDFKVRFQVGFLEGWLDAIPAFLRSGRMLSPKQLGKKDLIKEVHQELAKENFVALSYWTRIFYVPGTERYNKSGQHASGIVGRRWNKTERVCELKLRNSWGASCASYLNPELKAKEKCDPKTGYIWIPDFIFEREITDVAYYTKK